MANIFRVYKDSQVTTDRIRAEAAANSIVTPERVVYVFGTADDVAPNFTTFANAYFYAASLTPTVTEPVVVRLFTKTDGTPYDLVGDGDDPWLLYAQEYIYVYSDFKRQNVTDVLPTTLPAGLTVWYIDPNGVETLWVGREDGSAQLVTGSFEGTFVPTFELGDAGTITTTDTLNWYKNGKYVFVSGAISVVIDSPVGTVTLTNLPFTSNSESMGYYRVGASGSFVGLTNTTYAGAVFGNDFEMGDSASIPTNTTVWFNIQFITA